MKHLLLSRMLLGLLCYGPLLAQGQLQISFPVSRMVLQRSPANTATIRVTGHYTVPLQRIEARLLARDGQGTTTDWATIQTNPQGGVYAGDLPGRGGWYNVEVRGMVNDRQVAFAGVERVGVGEVFLVAGQSNAQGIGRYENGRDVNAPAAASDRVNCVNFFTESAADVPMPVFSRIEGGSNVAPGGRTGWCWGALGDRLAQRLNVPVLFMNAGWAATAMNNWEESYTRGTTFNGYTGQPLPPGQPYANLRSALRGYVHLLGVRAVLWHQGEADNRLNVFFPGTNTADTYAARLAGLINQSRQDSGKPLTWVVARASYDDQFKSNPNVLNGQNAVIAGTANVFAGPNTDGIQIPRNRGASDDVHFDAAGLVEVADAWNSSLTDNFFAASQPQSPAPMPVPSVSCADNNQLRMTVSGYASADWQTGQSGLSIVGGSGQYQAKVKDNRGNISYSPVFNVNPPPVISAPNGTVVCGGNVITLTASTAGVTWSNGSTGQSIQVGASGTFSASYNNDASGCAFTSNSVNVTVNAIPPAPTITAQKATVFCSGDNTVLASTSAPRYNWSNGSQSQQNTIGTSGIYFLTITDANGCTSPASNSIAVTANPTPAKPTVQASGPLTFCVDKSLTISAPDVPVGTAYAWSGGQTSQRISVTQSGQYSVRLTNSFNCTSPSSDVATVTINPLPATPTIQALGVTTFCAGNQVGLQVNSLLRPLWSNGGNTNPLPITASGTYDVRVQDDNGCVSGVSNSIPVTVNPVPARPVVISSGPLTFCADQNVTLTAPVETAYVWSNGQTSRSITLNQSGQFAVRVVNGFGCASESSAATTLTVNGLPTAPTIVAEGITTFCDGGRVTLRASTGLTPIWTTGETTATVTASRSGNYSARVQDANGCFSPLGPVVTVDVKPVPPQPVIEQTGAYVLQAAANGQNSDYRWTLGRDTLRVKTARLKANQSGTYTVRATNRYVGGLTCLSPESTPFLYDLPLDNDGLSVYPNPGTGQALYVETADVLTTVSISLFTLSGQRVFKTYTEVLAGPIRLNIGELLTGTYLLRIEADEYSGTKRILIGTY
jgi:hypothetical protein